MRNFKRRITKLEVRNKAQDQWKPIPKTVEDELLELNEIIDHFYPEHCWLDLPFEEQKRILGKWRALSYPETWDWRIAENPDKELHLAAEVSSLFRQGLYKLLNQLREAEEKEDSVFLLEIRKKLKLHFSYIQG